MNTLLIGSAVRVLHRGQPHGPVLTIERLRDHVPCDGAREHDAIAELSDGSWQFVWNLVTA